ncbi:MAG: pitrilysin family protein, partial [Actinomycetota bacterium]
MTSTRRGRTATRWIACLALLALLAAACSSGGDDEEADEPTTTTEAATTTTEAPAADDEPEPEPDPEVVLELPELDATPLAIDDDVTIGTLDNGLTYYLRSNDSPGSSLTVRLAVDAGSLQQDDPDAGTAHFLEHMLFNGTERYPGNELDRVLQTFGAGIGPDINAYTSYDETVYELTVTTTDNGDAVTTAFTVLAEWASNATIDPEEVVAERGVVRDEYRQRRENPDGRVNSELFEVYLAGTPYAGRSPIGEPDEIDATEAPALR